MFKIHYYMHNSVLQLWYTKVFEGYEISVHFAKILCRSLCKVFSVVSEPASDFVYLFHLCLFDWILNTYSWRLFLSSTTVEENNRQIQFCMPHFRKLNYIETASFCIPRIQNIFSSLLASCLASSFSCFTLLCLYLGISVTFIQQDRKWLAGYSRVVFKSKEIILVFLPDMMTTVSSRIYNMYRT